MARRRVEFRLSMPGRGSWDGRWSGEGLNYLLWRTLTAEQAARLGLDSEGATASWTHAWDDGWCASVTARVMDKGERRRKSAGFRGYDWMVRNILRWGITRCRCEWRPDPHPPRDEGAWERCVHCQTSRMTAESKVALALMKDEREA